MIKETVKKLLDAALEGWLGENGLRDLGYSVEIPPKEFEADLSLNLALSAGKKLKRNPRIVAEELIKRLEKFVDKKVVADFKIAGAGFINMLLSKEYVLNCFRSAVDGGFKGRELDNEKVCVEFVSANPTGPLHVGHGRGAAIGDSLARIYEHFGADVTREYYVNNIGNQIGILGKSLQARVKEIKKESFAFPEDGYKGEYIRDMAREYVEKALNVDYEKYAYETILGIIKADLEKFNVRFDSWMLENELHDSGQMDETLKFLSQKGALFDKDGALWLGSSACGDEKDRVVKRSDGRYTYLASDMAYHKNKIERGFARLVDIWGADHYGYRKRLEYAVGELGFDAGNFNIILYQLVRLTRGGGVVSMSTRSGEFVTLKEVVDEVGSDACRFFFLLRSPQSHLDFDLELAKKHTSENPVYYVQYAHARIASIFAEAKSRGIAAKAEVPPVDALVNKQELELLTQVVFFRDALGACLKDSTPHYITAYLIEAVKKFHYFYDNCRVLGGDEKTTQSRLWLIAGVKKLIATGLGLLGVSAPEKM